MVQPHQASEQCFVDALFAGDSEMAMLMRAHFAGEDSAAKLHSSLGSIETWAQSLKTALNILFNTGCPMLLVWGSDRLLFYNDAYSAILTKSNGAVPFGQPLSHMSATWSNVCSAVEQVFATERSLQCQKETPTGIPYTWCYSPLWDEMGRVGGVFATGNRVIPQKALTDPVEINRVEINGAEPDNLNNNAASQGIEETLRRREEQLSLITNALPVLIAYVDKDHYYRFNNQTYETWFGQPATTFTNRHIRDVLGEAAYQAVLPYMHRALAGQRLSYESQIPYLKGGTRYIQADYIPHINSHGEVEGYFSLVSDISDRKCIEDERTQTEANLRASEERFHFITQAVNGLIFDWNLRTNEVYRSQKLYDLIGIAPEDAPPDATWWHERIHPDDIARLQPHMVELLASSNHLYDAEYRIRHEAGYWVDVWEQACLIRDERGQVVRIVGCTVNISDRKRFEQVLMESEALARTRAEELTALMEVTPTAIWIAHDPHCHQMTANKMAYQLMGVESGTVTTATPADGSYPLPFKICKNGQPIPLQNLPMQTTARTGQAVTDELEFVFEDGRVQFIYGRTVPLYDSNGDIRGTIGAFMDITERKRIEEALRTSEERLRFAVEGAALGTWEYDLASSEIVWSEQAKRMFGLPLEAEVDYEVFMHTLHPDDRDRTHEAVEQAIAQREIYDVEFRNVWADASVHWVRAIGRARYDHNSVATRMIGVVLDITEHKQTEEDLRESERRFRRLVESNMFGVAFGDFIGGIHYVNDYFLTLLGYTREEFETGQVRWTDITPPEFLHLDEKAAVELRTRGVSTPFEKEYIRKDGSRVPILIGAALIQEPYDQQQEIIAFYIDLTEQKRAAAEREKLLQQTQAAREEAETANRIKDEFLAVLSHELRSPLNPILGWSRLLQTKTFDEEGTQRALQTIERNAKLQTELIDDLLDVSRILQGKMALNICPINLLTVIEAAMETVRLAADAKAIDLQFTMGHFGREEEPSQDPQSKITNPKFQVLGDAARLQQIVWNLLSNAVKFTPNGGRVDVRLEQVNEWTLGSVDEPSMPQLGSPSAPSPYIQIVVTDTGKGISPDFLPYVFDYFRQEDGKTTRKFGGLGLGLAIVRHLTELHGGTVHAESLGEGQGATFVVRLPLMANVAALEREMLTDPQAVDLSQLNVLLVDDDQDMRDLAVFILEQHNVKVKVAASAVEALRLFDRQQPDLLISDIGMPGMDGYALIQQIRQRSPQQGGLVPAIALTAYAAEYDQQQALKAGFQRHVAKPVEPEALIRAITNTLYSSKSHHSRLPPS
ncbi:PAS domain S-box protein [Oscillatoria sp. FACHB-1407]|uniref:PAS domain S-box protein n=1 Tax=Oscillatoria sp. FACHB-1407 TaxID=2692847 RepID=UPI001684AD0F|nr:PAS domain S-box protein [Oscillatoria sp. FACHB-1407]MBD2461925.1 PAS domain S-box protein [Oscillatoria sp. FACHB-1407]